MLTVTQLVAIMPRSIKVAAFWVEPLREAMGAFDIDTSLRVAMFLANIAHESAELTKLEEDTRYTSADRLLRMFPRRFSSLSEAGEYVQLGEEAIANRVYANRFGNGAESSGDGWRYRARGPIGITFKTNYQSVSKVLCEDDTLVDHPQLLIHAGFGAASAAWYWDQHGCNELADIGDFDGCCDIVNLGRRTTTRGDSNGFAERESYWRRAERVLHE